METKQKYISRYEKTKGGGYTFCGWRLCITRNKERYVRYFSDKSYPTPEDGLKAALTARDKILTELETVKPEEVVEYFRQCRRSEY